MCAGGSNDTKAMRTRLDQFDPKKGLDRGRPKWVEMIWYLLKCAFFLSALPWPSWFKVRLLRAFGGKVGRGVVIKPRVNVHFPWKLEIGDHAWIGEDATILNFEPIRVGSHCCISQQAYLCAGGHDFRDETFSYRNGPITIGDGVWIQARVFVCPGVVIGEEAVVTTCSVVTRGLPPNMICSGNPARERGPRWPL